MVNNYYIFKHLIGTNSTERLKNFAYSF